MTTVQSENYRGYQIAIREEGRVMNPRKLNNKAVLVVNDPVVGDKHDTKSEISYLAEKFLNVGQLIQYFVRERDARPEKTKEGQMISFRGCMDSGEERRFLSAEGSEKDIFARLMGELCDYEILRLLEYVGAIVFLEIKCDGRGLAVCSCEEEPREHYKYGTGFAYIEMQNMLPYGLEPGELENLSVDRIVREISEYDAYLLCKLYSYNVSGSDGFCEPRLCGSCAGSVGDALDMVKEEIDRVLDQKERETARLQKQIIENMETVKCHYYVYGKYIYTITPDMYGQLVIGRAEIKDHRIGKLDAVAFADIDFQLLKIIYNNINVRTANDVMCMS